MTKRYAVISGGVVIGAIMWDQDLYPDYVFPQPHDLLVESEDAEEGWLYQNGELVDPDPPPPPPPAPIYLALEKWRFWAIINMPGSLGETNLRAAIDAHADPVFKAVAKAKLNDPPGGMYSRDDPLFSNADLLGALSLTEQDVNDLWLQALALPN